MLRLLIPCLLLLLNGCSINQLTVRAAMPMVEGGITALYRETDLQLAQGAFAPNIELIEGMLVNDPDNRKMREYAAQAYYGYAYGFVEDEDKQRAAKLYRRGLVHGLYALRLAGFKTSASESTLEEFTGSTQQLDKGDEPALFWSASCWAKWIDMNRDDVNAIGELPKAVALMERVLILDENYFLAGPHIFMGVYHGGRSPMLGGNFELSAQHFDKARAFTQNKLLMVNVMQAQYLERQRFDQDAFHRLLTAVLDAPDDIFPEQALANTMAKAKAKIMLEKEDQWF
jgi:tetratricopeptide (TPR) repeat protein